MEFSSKKDLTKAIQSSITTNPARAIKAMLKIYENQTTDEQSSENTRYINGVGFTGTDARILSSFSRQYIERGKLSDKQMQIIMKKIGKYAKQLTEQAICNGLYAKVNGKWVVA